VAAVHRVTGLDVADARRSVSALAALGRAARTRELFGLPAPERMDPGPRVWADGATARDLAMAARPPSKMETPVATSVGSVPPALANAVSFGPFSTGPSAPALRGRDLPLVPDTHETLYLVRESWPRSSGRTGEIAAALIVDTLARPVRVAIARGSAPSDIGAMVAHARTEAPMRVVFSNIDTRPDQGEAELGEILKALGVSWIELTGTPRDNVHTVISLRSDVGCRRSPDVSEVDALRHAYHLLAGQASFPQQMWVDGWVAQMDRHEDPGDVAIGDLVCRLLLTIAAAALQHRVARALGRRLSIAETRSALQRAEGSVDALSEDPVLKAMLTALGVVESESATP
jgi:hypothetical protein